MFYCILADLVLVLHLAFIVFVVVGGLFALRWYWVSSVHLPAAVWGVFIEVSGEVCPFTPLENSLRRTAGASNYSEGFIEHYLAPFIYPAVLSTSVQYLLAGLVVLTNVLVYWFVWRRYREQDPAL